MARPASPMPVGTSSEWPLRVLLIANASYRHNAALRNPPRDVALLTQAFQARGAQVLALNNQNAAQLEAAVSGFVRDNRQRPGALWLGYSGHAVQINGRNYLQGVDSDFSSVQRVREHGVDLDLLLGLVERSRPQAAVVSIDACRNNPFEPERTRGLSQGLAATNPQGMCVSFSTAPYTKALDGEEGQYSPYAQALAKALAGQQSKSLDAVLRETADSVYRSTRQRQIPEYRSALRGEWWFGPRNVALRSLSDAPVPAGSVSSAGGLSREVSYRPDEPPAQAAYTRSDGNTWARLEMQTSQQLHRMSDAQVQALLQRSRQASVNEEDRLLAALVLQDGHRAAAPAPAQARKLLQPLAEQGHALAQTLLGESWYAAHTYDQAYKWLSLAARTDYGRAQTDLGQLNAAGLGQGDPAAGAIHMLRGMVQQHKDMTQPATVSPELMDAVQQLQKMMKP